MKPVYRQLRDAPIVPGAMNISHGEVMQAAVAAEEYVRSHPEARADMRWWAYQNNVGKPTPQSVRIRDMKERVAKMQREGRVG